MTLRVLSRIARYSGAKLLPHAVEWYSNLVVPVSESPRGRASDYLSLWEQTKEETCPPIDQLEQKLGYAIDAEWFQKLALLTQVVIKPSALNYQHGRLLYAVVSEYVACRISASVNILETGTARGFSALCMAKALADSHASGKILTFDVLPHDRKMYWNCIADEKGPQTRRELLRDYARLCEDYVFFCQGDSRYELRRVDMPRVNVAFLDGRHDYETVRKEFAYVAGRQYSGDLVVLDDYTPGIFPSVVRAVDEMCEAHGYGKEVIVADAQRGYALARKE